VKGFVLKFSLSILVDSIWNYIGYYQIWITKKDGNVDNAWFLWILDHAFWVVWCSFDVHTFDEFGFPWKVREIHHHICWWHTCALGPQMNMQNILSMF
jgi:hypothetical protein